MAVSKIPVGVEEIKLYDGGTTYKNDIGSTLTLLKPITGIRQIYITAYETYFNASSRRFIDIPLRRLTQAGFYVFGTDTGVGSVRVEFTNDSVRLISSTASSLFVQTIYGVV